MNVIQIAPIESAGRLWVKTILYIGIGGLLLLSQYALASDGELLADASGKVEGIIRGHGGKIVVLVGLIVATCWTGIKKTGAIFLASLG